MRSSVVVTALTLSFLMLPAASASMLYGVGGNHEFFSIDPVSLNVTTIGETGVWFGSFGDLAYDEGTGTMWWAPGRNKNDLYTINMTTGAATRVGTHGINDLFALGFANGVLYGGAYNGNVYTLNQTTGAPTFLANSGFSHTDAYDWNPLTERMIGVDVYSQMSLYAMDETGAATRVAWINSVNDGDIAFDINRNIYWQGDYSGNLYQYDSSWNRTMLRSDLDPIAGLEYVPDPVTVVPAPGAVLLAGAGLLTSLLRLRRERTV